MERQHAQRRKGGDRRTRGTLGLLRAGSSANFFRFPHLGSCHLENSAGDLITISQSRLIAAAGRQSTMDSNVETCLQLKPGSTVTASTRMGLWIHTGGDAEGAGLKSSSQPPVDRPYNPRCPGWPTLAAAALEAANEMTSHGKTCYFVYGLARRWPPDARLQQR